MSARGARMAEAIAFVASRPGMTMATVTGYVLGKLANDKPRAYKQAAMVVERIIRDRRVRQDSAGRLYPWNEKLRAYAEALERAANLAPDLERRRSTTALAAAAWVEAGDENRARILTNLALKATP